MKPSIGKFLSVKFLRIFTLLCFFSFSGLNNGFTYLIVSAHGVQRVDLTPLLLQKTARMANPLNWKPVILNFARTRLSRSVKVIEYASQRAVHNFLLEAALAQNWMRTSVSNLLGKKVQNAEVVKVQEAVHAVISGVPVEPSESQARVASQAAHFSDMAQQALQSGSSREFVKSERKKSWLLDRWNLWNGHRDNGLAPPGSGMRHDFREIAQTGAGFRHRLKCFIAVMPGKLRLWLSSSLSSRGDGDLALNGAFGLGKPPHENQMRGFSFGRCDD
ncbi:MAG: hypothetical protein A2901_00890 [Elusimicrobia bacterium RIFCSPLOWO2_01_FULL_54_10]|nr:MAG: hypothetical protein A2901_00890 [Elusimicrobia bacterium RIFCSPLOWO2_01_FULL_54_10]